MNGGDALLSFASAVFVGDVHLDSRIPVRESAFCRFLDHVKAEKPEALFLMGDIFEFWFGYRTVMFAETIRTVSKLAEVASAGIRVFYLAGNHDFKPGPVFSDYLGVSVCLKPLTVRFGSCLAYLSHGDEINFKDYGYRFLKMVLRNSFAQFLFGLIPAGLAWQLGRITSDTSRKYTDIKDKIPPDVYDRFVKSLAEKGYDVIIHAHTHQPGLVVRRSAGKNITVINSGHWFGPGHYVTFDSGRFALLEYPLE